MRAVVLATCFSLVACHAEAQLRSEITVAGLDYLVAFVADPLHVGVQYAVQQNGLILAVQAGTVLPTPFLDLRGSVTRVADRGLLGLAFAPEASTGRFYVSFTDANDSSVVARFNRSASDPLVADPSSRLDLEWPNGDRFIAPTARRHYGGNLAFGPDGYLYIGFGDGGVPAAAQDPQTFHGKMLRIDVDVPDDDVKGYRIPADNPFLDGDPISALGEIWAFGLRNPWRYSFDDVALGGSGALFIGDVGEGAREEIDCEPVGSGGRNYGWPVFEGLLRSGNDSTLAFTPAVEPLVDYPREGTGPVIGTSVTGGVVYRGSGLGSQYVGRYFFADYANGRIWSAGWLANESGEAVLTDILEHTSELNINSPISSFGVDALGELYIVAYLHSPHSGVLKIVRSNAPSDLAAETTGRTVTLNWSAVLGATQYRIEAGSKSGAANLAVFDTASAESTLMVSAVPDGVYYVRGRSYVNGEWSEPGNEIVVTIGCAGPPPPPTDFGVNVTGRTVLLTWTAPAPVSLIGLEVGSQPSRADLGVIVLPPSTRVSGVVPPGMYYARLRSVSECGISAPSVERVVIVP